MISNCGHFSTLGKEKVKVVLLRLKVVGVKVVGEEIEGEGVVGAVCGEEGVVMIEWIEKVVK